MVSWIFPVKPRQSDLEFEKISVAVIWLKQYEDGQSTPLSSSCTKMSYACKFYTLEKICLLCTLC